MKRLSAALLLLIMLAARAESFVARLSLSGASDAQRGNIALSVASLSGTRLGTGEVFSFNGIVGARTAARGFMTAENGRGVNVTGGGVAQTASAIDLALQASGAQVEYRARSTYGARYRGHYVPDSEDAILVDYASDIDYSFVNLGAPLTLMLWTDGDSLCCEVATEEPAPAPGSASLPVLELETGAAEQTPVAEASIPINGDEALLNNIRLAVESIDGVVIESGEEFSFNGLVGPRTAERGYLGALNGRGAKVIGGGVAQTASAIWLAVKQLEDVAVTQKETYGSRYNRSYVESSNDAILTDYRAGTDFRFKNKGGTPLTIRLHEDGVRLTCGLYRP